MACVRRAGLASIRRAFSTIQLRPEQWSSVSLEWPQNLLSTDLETFQNGKSFPCSRELLFGHKFFSTDASATVQIPEGNQAVSREGENTELQALKSEEEEGTLIQLNKIDENPEKKKLKLVDATREIWRVLEKGDADMEETLTQLGIQVTPRLVKTVLDRTDSLNSALRFFKWAKAQPEFRHSISTYDKLVDVLGRSRDFETLQRVLSERFAESCSNSEEEGTLLQLNKIDENPEKKKWKLVDATREIRRVLEKGDADMEETLTQSGIQVTPRLVKTVLDATNSPSSALRFFQWAKAQPGFRHSTSTYDKLVNVLGRSRDFETLQRVLSERFAESCSNSDKTFSFATANHGDPNLLNEVMEMIEKLEISARRDSYEKLVAALFKENHVDAAEVVLEKMASADCIPKMFKFYPLISYCCQKYQMDKLKWVFEMMKMYGCPPGPICYNFVLSILCKGERFTEAAELLGSMAKMGCKPNALTYDIMIKAACMMGRIQGALQLFDRMKEEGINPLYHTHTILLYGLFQTRGFNEAHSFLVQESGKDSILDLSNYEYLISVCSKSGRGQEARYLLMEMEAKDLEFLDDQLVDDVLQKPNLVRQCNTAVGFHLICITIIVIVIYTAQLTGAALSLQLKDKDEVLDMC